MMRKLMMMMQRGARLRLHISYFIIIIIIIIIIVVGQVCLLMEMPLFHEGYVCNEITHHARFFDCLQGCVSPQMIIMMFRG